MNPLTTLFGAKTGSPPKSASLDLERLEERLLLSWTFMVYVDGDNNLEDAAIDDFLEMSGVGSTADVNVVVQMDRISGYDTRYGNWTDTRQGLVSSGDVPDASWGASIGEANMGAPDTLTAFATWAIGAYPADNYALVLWDHGGGWRSAGGGTRDCCWDDTSGSDYLANNEVRGALEAIPTNIDLLGFDACLMGMIETAYEMRNEATVLVASEETEPWDGWPYDTILADLVAQPTMDAASLGGLIAYRYYESYGPGQWVTQSATDLSAVVAPGGLADSVSNLATVIMSTATVSDYTALQTHRFNSAYYWDIWGPYFIDLGDFLTGAAGDAALTATISAAASTALTAYNGAIISSYADPGWGTGLSIYFQDEGVSPDFGYNGSTIDFPVDTQWDEFLAWWEDGPSATEGSISGSKWEDTDGNGTWDAGEPGLEGWTIFLDQNQNGILDGGETSTATDSYGFYAFSGLSAGTYHVAEVLQTGWEQTFPTGGTHTVPLSAGESITGLDFGNWQSTATAEIHGSKWEDLNGDGVWDAGEPGLVGWTIFLDQNQNGVLDAGEASIVTGSDGSYSFTGLDAGTYYVAEVLQAGWAQTYPVRGRSTAVVVPGDAAAPEDVEMVIIDSPPTPPPGHARTVVDAIPRAVVMLDGVPTSTWTYGCSATSAGMIFGYYDRHGYPSMYVGPANGGVAPLTDLGQGDDPANPIAGATSIIATQNGFDGRVTNGHVDDYWIAVYAPGPDPWEGNWTEHAWGDCTADFMGTNQWKWDFQPFVGADGIVDSNGDGATALWWSLGPDQLVDYVPDASGGLPQTGLCHGLRLFAESRGYEVVENYSQRIDTVIPGGFSFADYMAEIDGGYPVMIYVEGHSMVGVGYDDAAQTVYLHDTWDNSMHSMTWGGDYAGMAHMAMTVIHLEPGQPGAGQHTVDLAEGEIVTDINFGNQSTVPVNDPPVLTTVDILTGASEDTPFDITYQMMATAGDESDPDGDTVSFRVESITNGTLTEGGVAVTPGTSLLDPGETWVWQGPTDANGLLAAFRVRAWDGQAASASDVQVSVQVAPVNDAPMLTTVATLTGALTEQDFTITYDTLAAAADEYDVEGDVLSFRVQSVTSGTLTEGGSPVLPGTTLLSPGENLVWNPGAGVIGDVDAFTVVAWDGLLPSSPDVQVRVSVNNAPTLTTIDTLTGAQEDTQFQITYVMLAAAADEDDLDGDTVSFRLESVTGGVLTEGGLPVVAGVGLLEPGEAWDWAPPLDANGTLAAFTVRAWDSEAASATPVQVRVDVAAVNDAPQIVALADAPDPVTRPAALTLTALGVADVDGTVAAVEFYRDGNGNGTFDDGVDVVLGPGVQDGADWAWSDSTAGWPMGTFTYFARAQDDPGAWSEAASTGGTVQNSVPVVGLLTDEPDPVYRPDDLTLTATGVGDMDGAVVRAEFYRDANGNGVLDPGVDMPLGIDLNEAGGWTWSGSTAGWAPGAHTYFVRVQDDDLAWSGAAAATGAIPNLLPGVGSLSDSPDPIVRPGTLMLTAADVQDPDGSVVRVAFYRDANGNGTLEPGTDVLLGEDTIAANGWSWSGLTTGWPTGTQTYFARPQDNDGGWGDAALATGTIQNAPPVVSSVADSPDPVTRPDALTLKAEGAGDVDGFIALAEFYRDANGNATFEPDLDLLLGSDGSAVGGWSWSGSTLGWPVGDHTYFARVRDNDGTWSGAVAAAGTVRNAVPTVASMSDTPDPVTRPAAATLSAAGVADRDGQIVRVEFYLDTNRSGALEIGSDALLGEDTQGGDGWSWGGSVALWPLGSYGAFARAQDDDGAWSAVVSTAVTVQNALPAVGSLAQTPGEVARPDVLTLTASDVVDPDGTVQRVEFYRDANGNGVLDPASDLLLGIDANGANGWGWNAATTAWPLGEHVSLARAHDSDAAWGGAAAAIGVVSNAPPVIVALADGPDPVTRSEILTLDAQGANDPDGSITMVEFYRDADGDGELDPGTDTLLGVDTDGGDGWSWSGSTLGWLVGTHTYLARARDDDAEWSAVSATTGSVQNAPPVVASLAPAPDPVGVGQILTLTAEGVADADGAVTRVEFYLDNDGVLGLNPATDELAGVGVDTGGGVWELALDTRGWALGTNAYVARAQDDDGDWSGVAGTEVRVGYTLVESQVVDRATVSFYDVDASNGVISPEVIEWSPLHYGLSSSTAVFVNLGFFGDGVIDSILLLGNGNVTADLGIVVEDNLALGTVVDVRTAPQPLQFLVSEGAVNYVSLLSGVAGGSLNGFTTEAGWSLAADIDGDGDTGDRTGLYSGGRLGVVIARGSVAGDIVAGGNLDYLQVNGGDLNGDVVLTASNLGMIVTIGGDMAGNVMAPAGSIGSLIAVNGNIDLSSGRQIRARSSISAVHAIGGSILGGGGGGITVDDGHLWSLYTSGDLTADVTAHGNLGVVSVGGSVRNASIWADGSLNTLYALGDFHNTNVRATRLGVVYVGGEITEEDSDGEDEIRALEAQFFVLDSQKSAWIAPGSPVEFGGVTAWVG